ncbi:hypothetical protein CCAE64S_02261 [Castellaniella caeni]
MNHTLGITTATALRAADTASVGHDGTSTAYVSLLFPAIPDGGPHEQKPPAYFVDLNLDQLAKTLAGDDDAYDLLPLLYTAAPRVETITHRHAIFRDLEKPPIQQAVESFLQGLEQAAEQRGRMGKAHHPHEASRRLLDAQKIYCEAVRAFAGALRAAQPASVGFRSLADYLDTYIRGDTLLALEAETTALLEALGTVRYDVLIQSLHVEVSRHQDEPDYGAEIARMFERFQSGRVAQATAAPSKPVGRWRLAEEPWLNAVEERILTQLAMLFPALFTRIDSYVRRYAEYADEVVVRVARELRFFLAYRHYIAPLQVAGQPFCYPSFAQPGEPVAASEACDLVLAHHLAANAQRTVSNDFRLDPPERLLLISGPNQGGKTTLARTFGQLHHLARLGVPVPARSAVLLWWNTLYTHFERAEDIHNLHGKLEDDLVRLDPAIVSMASTVDPQDPAIRTFKVLRQPPDGKAYAHALAAKHHLTRKDLEARI